MNKFVYDIIEERKRDDKVNERNDLISLYEILYENSNDPSYIQWMKNGQQPDANETELRDFVTNFM
jgi:hypothetical protein